MTYAEAVAYRSTLEAAFAAGELSVSIGDRSVTYKNSEALRVALNQINRDIAAYENRLANRNPGISRPRWR